MAETQLKDVKCERCGRAIGQRNGALLIQFGMKTLFPKSGKIFCPFVGCGAGNDFKVNRAKVDSPSPIFKKCLDG